jgi:hypothetical protein
MEARIPFAGFYESVWSSSLDDEEEQYAMSLAEKHDIKQDEVTALIFQHCSYGLAHRHIAAEYVDVFESFINDKLGTKIVLTYVSLDSPKYYNFETDQIIASIEYSDALILARRVGRNALRKAAKQMFTSRDGFISFYRNDPAEWGRLRGWDHNQLYCLLTAAVDVIDEEDYEFGLLEDLSGNGTFSEALFRGLDNEDLMVDVGKLVGKKELLEEQEEESDDGRRFPVAFEDTPDYVERYNKLNSKEL